MKSKVIKYLNIKIHPISKKLGFFAKDIKMNFVTEEKLNKYFKITERAIKKIKIKIPKKIDLKKVAEDYLDMAARYIEDARYFKKNGDYVTAFAALNYAHGFLDAGARLKVFDVKDSELFAAD